MSTLAEIEEAIGKLPAGAPEWSATILWTEAGHTASCHPFMPLLRLFAEKPNAIRMDEIPALDPEEIRQRENETQFGEPDANYAADWPAAKEDAAMQWRALGVPTPGR